MSEVVGQILGQLSKSRANRTLRKSAGLGSRGGQVIAMTRRGHPVYAGASANSYPHFNSDDHRDAMAAHHKHMLSTNDREQSVFSDHQALIHHTLHAFGRN